MKLVHTQDSLSKILDPLRSSKKIGFVPTMGALHKGHLSLVSKGLEQNDLVVVSIFVNPTQFDNAADLKKYPRTLEKDLDLLKSLKGDVIVFAPEAQDLYNGPVSARKFRFGPISNEMEGKHRKGHFDGVGTVVSLLLRAVRPHIAYFGEKDFQQLQIVKKLVEIEQIPTKIIGCEIIREANGLAMSSRNKRLSKEQKEAAGLISSTLQEVQKRFRTQSVPKINDYVAAVFRENPSLRLEYFEIADEKSLKTVVRKRDGNRYRAFIAVFAEDVRLIDNMQLPKI